jgi:hypothetical protein
MKQVILVLVLLFSGVLAQGETNVYRPRTQNELEDFLKSQIKSAWYVGDNPLSKEFTQYLEQAVREKRITLRVLVAKEDKTKLERLQKAGASVKFLPSRTQKGFMLFGRYLAGRDQKGWIVLDSLETTAAIEKRLEQVWGVLK